MKLTINSGELMKAAAVIGKAVPAKTTIAILENFLFSVTGDKLTLTGSDGDVEACTALTATDTAEGSCCIPSRYLLDLLKSMDNAPVTIESDDASVTVTTQQGKFCIPAFNAVEYPRMKTPSEKNANSVVIATKTLVLGIGNSDYAAGNDEARPIMSGLCFDFLPDRVNIVASDSHMLACKSIDGIKAGEAQRFVLHSKNTAVVKHVLDGKAENTTILFDGHAAQFICGDTTVNARLMTGKYPKYGDVIPKDNSFILSIAKDAFEKALKRITVCTDKESSTIKLDIEPETLTISGQDLKFGTSATEKVPCSYTGEPMVIGFKSGSLLKSLGEISGEKVVIKLKEPRKAALLEPEDNTADPLVCLLMPSLVK